jgi:hypothetical protein
MNPEITARLREQIPDTMLCKNPRGFDYIKPHTAIDRLIQATGDEGWSFRITNVIHSPGHVAMQGELTIAGDTRSDWGEAKTTNNPNEELFKTCQSDTLKRCARMFGVALELYGEWVDEETGEVTHKATAQPRQNAPRATTRPDTRRNEPAGVVATQNAPAATQTRQADVDDATQPALSTQVQQLFDLGRQLNIYVKKFVAAEFGGRDVNGLTYAEAALLIEDWQAEVAQQAVGT